MKRKNQKRRLFVLSGLGLSIALVAVIFALSSFDTGAGSGSAFFFQTDPPQDCSTSVVIYNNNSTWGSGGGSISGSGNASGGSGSVSGSGSGGSSQSGAIGTLYTPQSKTNCSLSIFASCYSNACHATGPGVFTHF